MKTCLSYVLRLIIYEHFSCFEIIRCGIFFGYDLLVDENGFGGKGAVNWVVLLIQECQVRRRSNSGVHVRTESLFMLFVLMRAQQRS